MPLLLHGGLIAAPDPVLANLPSLVAVPSHAARVVIVAMHASERSAGMAIGAYSALGMECRAVDAATSITGADHPVLQQIAVADVVHLAGGSAPIIAGVLRGSPLLERALREAAWLVAESGAAMALGAWALGCPDSLDPPDRGLQWLPQCVIDAHFNEPDRRARVAALLDLNPTLLGVGIDEATALLVEGRNVREARVLGSGLVHLLDAHGAPSRTGSQHRSVAAR